VTARDAISLVEKRGVVAESALDDKRAARALRDHEDVLACRLAGGATTFVHRRLWPALVRLAPLLPADRLAQMRDGADVPFPDWVTKEVRAAARRLSDEEARAQLGRAFDSALAGAPVEEPPAGRRGR